jgi:hypothetical protein
MIDAKTSRTDTLYREDIRPSAQPAKPRRSVMRWMIILDMDLRRFRPLLSHGRAKRALRLIRRYYPDAYMVVFGRV